MANRTGTASMTRRCQPLVLQATAGLAAHQMAGFDANKARELFAIPPEYSPMAMIAVGYQGDPDILEGERREKEKAPRSRRPIGTSFFAGTWGVPID